MLKELLQIEMKEKKKSNRSHEEIQMSSKGKYMGKYKNKYYCIFGL